MKKLKIFFFALFVFGMSTTAINADMKNLGHNSGVSLQYGKASTLCTDNATAHSYWTTGYAHNTGNTRLAVYIRNASGVTVASSSSSSYSTWAGTQWTRSATTTHSHSAASALIY